MDDCADRVAAGTDQVLIAANPRRGAYTLCRQSKSWPPQSPPPGYAEIVTDLDRLTEMACEVCLPAGCGRW